MRCPARRLRARRSS